MQILQAKMIKEISIKNYKSILNHTIELGRINVFIGENGCGKTNILEAVALMAAAETHKTSQEELFSRGIRPTKPRTILSSFSKKNSKTLTLKCVTASGESVTLKLTPSRSDPSGMAVLPDEHFRNAMLNLGNPKEQERKSRMVVSAMLKAIDTRIKEMKSSGAKGKTGYLHKDFPRKSITVNVSGVGVSQSDALLVKKMFLRAVKHTRVAGLVEDFAIYNADALCLRGLQTISRKSPMGLYGENLDGILSGFSDAERKETIARARCVSWLEDVVVDDKASPKYAKHKSGQSHSDLYFLDKYMKGEDRVLPAESVNEGVLHVLFHLVLFASKKTPRIFGIDNLDTALNPQLCRGLIRQLTELSLKNDKQALITTHNPAVLDGLNLHDDQQRLFVVYRNDKGHTVTKRVNQKPKTEGTTMKLSELWMRGHLGGIPRSF